MAERLVKVEEVERDPISKKVLWVRIQYFKNGELLHDVRFVQAKRWVRIAEKIVGDFIPKNRYLKMVKKAAGIIYDKKSKKAEQMDLPLK